jgi:hypothetical protein
MHRLSKALKRLKGKPKETKDESASSRSSDPSQSSGVPWKTIAPQLPSQGSQKLNASSKVTTSNPQTPASSAQEIRQASVQKLSSPVSTSTVAPLQPKPQPVLIEVPKETPKSEPQRELLDAEEVKDESVIRTAPKELAQSSSSGEALAVNPQPQPVPEPTVTATEAIPQPPPPPTRTVAAPRAIPQPPRLPTPPTFTTPKATSRRTPQAKPYAPKPTPKSVPIPAVQRHAGLFSGFTPGVAAIDQPTPAILYNAKKTASNVLLSEASPSYPSATNMGHPYARQDDYTDLIPIPSYSSYATPSPYSSSKPLGTFHTGGALGGGLYSGTGGAIGGGAISHTGGRLGEGSVSQTGGSLGEAVGVQPPVQSFGLVRPLMPPPRLPVQSPRIVPPLARPPRLPVLPRNIGETLSGPESTIDRIVAILAKSGSFSSLQESIAELEEEDFQEVRKLLQEYSRDPWSYQDRFALGSSNDPLGLGRGGPSGQAQEQSQKYSAPTQPPEPWESLYD